MNNQNKTEIWLGSVVKLGAIDGTPLGTGKTVVKFIFKKYCPGHARRAFFDHPLDAVFQTQFANSRAYTSSFQEEMLLPCWIPYKSDRTNHPFPLLGGLLEPIF